MNDASRSLQQLAEPSTRGDRVKSAIERAARLSGLSYWRTFDLWYRKARKVEDFELDAIQEALDHKHQKDLRNELRELQVRIARLEEYFVQTDEAFHREDLDALGETLRALERGLPKPR